MTDQETVLAFFISHASCRGEVNMKVYQLIAAEHTKYEIQLTAVSCGGDLSVVICGGQCHHVGAAALALGILPDGGRPKYSATVSTLSVPDHKDSVIAQELSAFLADSLGCRISMTVGIHMDEASKEDISILCENSRKICQKLLLQLNS